jgi:addiction module HigA family antidote
MAMKNPPHPGGLVLRQCIEPLGLTITAAAAALGVTRTTLSELVNDKRGISPEMAVRLSQVFGGSAASWLTQQAHYDLAQVRSDRIKTHAAGIGVGMISDSSFRCADDKLLLIS